MNTRRVRGQSGAIFEVDPSMLDERPSVERGYRESSAPPHASEILRAPPRDRFFDRLAGAVFVLTLAVLILGLLR